MHHLLTAVRSSKAILVLGALPLVTSTSVLADATTDCFPHRIASFQVGTVSSPPAYNTWQPGIVIGPPGDATPTTGSLSVMSLGKGGVIVLEFNESEIVDGPGPDLIVFENPFFCTGVPLSASDPYSVFAEPGIVAVSDDGMNFRTFPYDASALSTVNEGGCTNSVLLQQLIGLAGITPNFTGNYTIPDDPLLFDPTGPGGVSGHGGDAFDLAMVGLTRARFVRITDPNLPSGIPGSSEGFDLDAIVALHAEPLLGPGQVDTDGDGLSDEAEVYLYHTDPTRPDTDGDGVPDGVEAATCRDPLSTSTAPFFLPVLEMEVSQDDPTVWRWNFLGSGVTYDVIQGSTQSLRSVGGLVDLGVVTCIENDSTDLTTLGHADAGEPAPGEAFFYLVRQNPAGSGLGYGLSSAHEPRIAASGDCQ